MAPLPELDREQRLDELLADYLRAVRDGSAPNRQALLATHPDLADDLRDFFADQDRFNRLASPLREVVPPPDRIARLRDFGPYELLGEIARGGMGVVFRARHKGLGRVVALKMLLAGPLAAHDDLQRFRREAEAAASLDHPHIVPIYEVGTHDGHPYLSMKLLGGSLAGAIARGQFAVRNRASAARAAGLVVPVARAVHHAHQRGILHRDLKPANILLDEENQPHVADFGLARRTGAAPRREAPAPGEEIAPTVLLTNLTHTGAAVGTPGYMAPEQASGERGAVTVTSDVYGLGAVLYELLTGRAPFRGPTPYDTLRRVLEDEAPRPASINRHVDRDLETIALKCLEKQPSRRYPSAADLADDLERYLKGEPIRARRVGAFERARRWAQRKPAIAGLLLLLAVVLASGFGLVLHQWQRAEANFDVAREKGEEARAQRDEAVRAEEVAEKHRQEALALARVAGEERDKARREKAKADASFRQAHSAVNNFCLWLSQELKEAPNLQPLRIKLLRTAQRYYQGFLAQRGQDPTLRMELANTHELVAQIASATGSRSEAIAAYKQAVAMYRQLHREDPKNVQVRRRLPGTLINLSTLQDVKGARKSLEEALGYYERFVPEAPGDLDLERGLASTERNLGVILGLLGMTAEGEDHYGRALRRQKEMVRQRPDRDLAQADLAVTLHNLGALASRQAGKQSLSLCYYLAAYEVRLRLARARPDDAYRQAELAASLHNLGVGLRNVGRKEEHYEALRDALDVRQKLVAKYPHVTRYKADLAATLVSLGRGNAAEGNWKGALSYFEPAREMQAQLVEADRSNAGLRKALGETHFHVGTALGALDRRPEEEESFEKARALQEALVRAEPDNLQLRWELSSTLNNLGYGLKMQGKLDRARPVVRQAIANSRVLVARAPWASHQKLLVTHHALLAEIERQAGRAGAAAAVVRQRQQLSPNDPAQQYRCASEFVRAGGAVGKGKQALTPQEEAEREGYYKEAMAALRKAVALGLRDPAIVRKDVGLVPLHDRADFRALLSELETKARKSIPRKSQP